MAVCMTLMRCLCFAGQVQAVEVQLQAQAAAANGLVPMHGSSKRTGQVPGCVQNPGVSHNAVQEA